MIALGYLAVVSTVYNLWRTGAAAAGGELDEGGWTTRGRAQRARAREEDAAEGDQRSRVRSRDGQAVAARPRRDGRALSRAGDRSDQEARADGRRPGRDRARADRSRDQGAARARRQAGREGEGQGEAGEEEASRRRAGAEEPAAKDSAPAVKARCSAAAKPEAEAKATQNPSSPRASPSAKPEPRRSATRMPPKTRWRREGSRILFAAAARGHRPGLGPDAVAQPAAAVGTPLPGELPRGTVIAVSSRAAISGPGQRRHAGRQRHATRSAHRPAVTRRSRICRAARPCRRRSPTPATRKSTSKSFTVPDTGGTKLMLTTRPGPAPEAARRPRAVPGGMPEPRKISGQARGEQEQPGHDQACPRLRRSRIRAAVGAKVLLVAYKSDNTVKLSRSTPTARPGRVHGPRRKRLRPRTSR